MNATGRSVAEHRRSLAGAAYAAVCALLFTAGAWLRFAPPQWPVIDPDTWNYLWPALSAIEGGGFTHAGGRAFPYPLFLWGVLATFGDFRAIPVVQHLLALGTALLMLAAWHRAALLIDPARRLWPGHLLLGVVLLFAALFYPPGLEFERTILPETCFTFAMALSVALLLFAFDRCRAKGGAGAALLLGLALASGLVTLSIKPHWLLAAGATALAVVWAGRAARIAWSRLALAVGIPVLLFAVGFVLPERRLAEAHDRAGSALFLPKTMFCWHLAAVLPTLRDEAANPAAASSFRALVLAIDQVLADEVFVGPGAYLTLGYDADKCMYGTLGNIVALHFNGDIARQRDFYWRSFARGAAARPVAYARKVLREMRAALAAPLPFLDVEPPAGQSLAIAGSLAGKSAVFDRAVEAMARPGDASRSKALGRLNRRFYRPLAIAVSHLFLPALCLALAGAALATAGWGRGIRTAPPGIRDWRFVPLFGVAALYAGINLTIALSHSQAMLRYRMAQYPLSFLLLATALMTVGGLLAVWYDGRRGAAGQPPQFGAPSPGRTHLPRPGAYAVVFDRDGRLLVVEEDGRLYLPGGGIDPGESPEQGLVREFREETGYEIVIRTEIGRASEYVADETPNTAFNKHCIFFTVRLAGGTGVPAIASNRPSWMALDDALARLNNEAHRWAVNRVLRSSQAR
ncbi:MAG: NUDIX domain-containing protein [Alphaproteobacteria bacterium]|nr:NUDIX domain-containing protein [Alphaproteobacteria bacterium]